MRVPDFFIVGAPKCGTTALYTYLCDHPAIFMSPIKEPHFFATDFPRYRLVTRYDDYLRLFADAPANALLGEASVWYLYSNAAIANIVSVNPKAKFIVMLRNPVDLVQSLHAQLLFSFNEDIENFWQAWQLQDHRADGQRIPRYCREPRHLLYREVGMLGAQVARLRAAVSAEQVQLILFDDFIRDTTQIYGKVLSFLELPYHERQSFAPINVAKSHRNHILARIIRHSQRNMYQHHPYVYRSAKKMVNSVGLRPLHLLKKHNQRALSRPAISSEHHEILQSTFQADVGRLEKMMSRSLESWRTLPDRG